jgi:hypothetical protein
MTLEFWRRALRPSPIRNHLMAEALSFALLTFGIVWGLNRLLASGIVWGLFSLWGGK